MGDESGMIKIGPVVSKYDNDVAWDEKGHDNMVQIFVFRSGWRISSIQFQYVDENGSLVLSKRHGGNGGSEFDVVKLNHPEEYITWISGQTNGSRSSITFGTITNNGEYGPFGPLWAHNTNFCFNLGEGRQFGGFYCSVDKSTGAGRCQIYWALSQPKHHFGPLSSHKCQSGKCLMNPFMPFSFAL